MLFLYKAVVAIELPWIEGIRRLKRPPKRSTVLTKTEVGQVLDQMSGVCQLIARLLYGTGMRLFECAQLRIKGVDPKAGTPPTRCGIHLQRICLTLATTSGPWRNCLAIAMCRPS